MNILFIAIPALLGGLTQGIAGFGSAIIMMLFLPLFLTVLQGSAIVQAVSLILCLSMIISYRKYVNLKLCMKPLIIYFPIYYIALSVAVKTDASFLKPFLGLFMTVLSLYFIFIAGKFSVKEGWKAAGVCATLSATIDAFFGIGGPPMVVYYLSTTKEKEEYLGSVQMSFFVANVIGVILRYTKGQYTLDMIPYIIIGMIMVVAGKTIGGFYVQKINQEKLKKIVYIFIGIAGLITFFTNV